MTREEAIALLKIRVDLIKSNYPEIDDYREALEMAIEALKQGTCEDVISRQAVLEWCGDINMDVYTNEVKEYVLSLPPVTPQPKTGRWVRNKCDKCGASRPPLLDNYCPNCGIKMQEVGE